MVYLIPPRSVYQSNLPFQATDTDLIDNVFTICVDFILEEMVRSAFDMNG